VIRRTLRAVMDLEWPDLEVLVVDDGSDDRTVDISMTWQLQDAGWQVR
jgi:glycosyltransferase involved in cell wall biosynthesis